MSCSWTYKNTDLLRYSYLKLILVKVISRFRNLERTSQGIFMHDFATNHSDCPRALNEQNSSGSVTGSFMLLGLTYLNITSNHYRQHIKF